jgi:hypothetical protein
MSTRGKLIPIGQKPTGNPARASYRIPNIFPENIKFYNSLKNL